jgi:hypothetical protein
MPGLDASRPDITTNIFLEDLEGMVAVCHVVKGMWMNALNGVRGEPVVQISRKSELVGVSLARMDGGAG